MKKGVSVEALGKLLGIGARQIQTLAAKGIIPRAARGEYDLVGAVQGYIAHLKAIGPGPASKLRRAASKDGLTSTDVAEQKQAEELRLTKAKADLEEVKVKKALGELVEADKALQAFTWQVGCLKSNLLSLPTSLAPELRAAESDHAAQKSLEKAIRQALEQASQATIEVVLEDEPPRAEDEP